MLKKYIILLIIILVGGIAGLWWLNNRHIKNTQISVSTSPCLHKDQFVWGVGVSLFSLTPYNPLSLPREQVVNASYKLIDLASELGVNTIRIQMSDWAETDHLNLILPAVKYARSKNLDISLILEDKPSDMVKSNPQIYENAKVFGREMGTSYKDYVCYFQVSNELSGKVDKPDWPGNTPDSIDDQKYDHELSWVRGVSESLRQYAPQSKQVLTGHWMGSEVFKRIGTSVNYDVIGWDWFQESTNLSSIGPEKYDLTNALLKNNKQLWIAEAAIFEPENKTDAEQAKYLNSLASNVIKSGKYNGYFPFQIADLPTGVDKVVPSYRGGLTTLKQTDKTWEVATKKQAFYDYQKTIRQNSK